MYSRPFLQNFNVSQEMPILSVELSKAFNFAKLVEFRRSRKEAKSLWQRELGKDSEAMMKFKENKYPSSISPIY